jgi:uncharacterized protein YbaR (Trm112 family)
MRAGAVDMMRPTVIPTDLVEILACPACDARPKVVLEGQDRLVCTQCGRRYPIRDEIPVMLVDEAEPAAKKGDQRA